VKLIDEATITVQSGKGGSGCVSFRREKFVPKGGPDGGDGGRGGDVILKVSPRRRTLQQFRYKKHFQAQNGAPGQGSNKTGKNGENSIVELPPGTVVRNADTGELIKDFVQPGESLVIAAGGRGGQGNTRFKSSTHRTPRFAQPGEPGQSLTLHLDLKLLADVGIIGLPNAGKSTLIRAMTSARPKVGDYPFTTLTPNLGVVETGWAEPFVVADIPGLIEGAHEGAGLGIRFLKHVERTRILVHLVDALAVSAEKPLAAYEAVNRELSSFNPALAAKPQIVVLNKLDRPGAEAAADRFRSALDDVDVLDISALERRGVESLVSRIVQLLENIDEQ
jgi:GTP-binding protein